MSCSERILVIEDELPMRTALHDCLARQGYRVLLAANGEDGLTKAVQEQPDLVLLDLMLPGLDGLSLCAELRRLGKTTPILMLTAKARVEDRVRGLNLGADDFLAKPFSRDELLARVRALLRRVQRQGKALTTEQLGAVQIDFVRQRVFRNEREIHLTAKEFAALRLLFERQGKPISREQFLDIVWGFAAFPTTRTVDRHMASLRAKIEEDPDHPLYIQTVHGVGYRLEIGEELGDAQKVTQPSQFNPGIAP